MPATCRRRLPAPAHMPSCAYLGQEGVEAQDELRVALEQVLDLLNHAGCVDPVTVRGTAGVRAKKTLVEQPGARGWGAAPGRPATHDYFNRAVWRASEPPER